MRIMKNHRIHTFPPLAHVLGLVLVLILIVLLPHEVNSFSSRGITVSLGKNRDRNRNRNPRHLNTNTNRPRVSTLSALGLFRKSKGGHSKIETPIPNLEDNGVLLVADDVRVGVGVDEETETETETEPSKTETLRFGGKNSYTSQIVPIPADADLQNIHDFFAKFEHQKILLTGGKNDSSEMEELDVQSDSVDSQKWIENAKFMGGDEPNFDRDRVHKVIPQGIKIVTLEVLPLSVIGTKIRSTAPNDVKGFRMPEFQAVLIDDQPTAIGPRFSVWLFNKIVYGGNPNAEVKAKGKGKEEKTASASKQRRRDEKAMLRFWAERRPVLQPLESESDPKLGEDSDSDLDSSTRSEYGSGSGSYDLVFRGEAELWLEFEFPSILLRFFPLSKEKAEELCSDAISRALNINLQPAVEKFTEMYLESKIWKSNGTHTID